MEIDERVEAAYAEERFNTPISEVRRRRRGPIRRHPGVLATAFALLAVVAGWLAITGPAAETSGALDSACRRQWPGPGPLPDFAVGTGRADGIRVYPGAADPGPASGRAATFYCVPDAPGRPGGDDNSSVVDTGPHGPTIDVVAISITAKTIYYAGVVPAGTDRIDFVSDDGRVWAGRVVDDFFAASLPADSRDHTVLVSAHGVYGVAVVAGPVLHHAGPARPWNADACAASAAELATVPMARALGPVPPARRIDLVGDAPAGTLPDEAVLLASGPTIAICRDSYAMAYFGSSGPLTALGFVAADQWTLGGSVPPGATSVTLDFADGTKATATIRDGYWLAWDAGNRHPGPRSVTAFTPTGRYTVQISG